MKTLVISANTLQEWDIEDILDNKSGFDPKEIYGEIMYEAKKYSEDRKDMYNLFQLEQR
jgi:hypothetical protein